MRSTPTISLSLSRFWLLCQKLPPLAYFSRPPSSQQAPLAPAPWPIPVTSTLSSPSVLLSTSPSSSHHSSTTGPGQTSASHGTRCINVDALLGLGWRSLRIRTDRRACTYRALLGLHSSCMFTITSHNLMVDGQIGSVVRVGRTRLRLLATRCCITERTLFVEETSDIWMCWRCPSLRVVAALLRGRLRPRDQELHLLLRSGFDRMDEVFFVLTATSGFTG